jgi:hypothetical protein
MHREITGPNQTLPALSMRSIKSEVPAVTENEEDPLSCSSPQHLQCPTPSRFSKHAPSLHGRGPEGSAMQAWLEVVTLA